mmetsp:Transcript_14917/g.28486  ORF Transcript_14917/g.28486 Transcript_14917/m.28486 type:complete len:201 (-) Transcript_14917:524-1126(-)
MDLEASVVAKTICQTNKRHTCHCSTTPWPLRAPCSATNHSARSSYTWNLHLPSVTIYPWQVQNQRVGPVRWHCIRNFPALNPYTARLVCACTPTPWLFHGPSGDGPGKVLTFWHPCDRLGCHVTPCTPHVSLSKKPNDLPAFRRDGLARDLVDSDLLPQRWLVVLQCEDDKACQECGVRLANPSSPDALDTDSSAVHSCS